MAPDTGAGAGAGAGSVVARAAGAPAGAARADRTPAIVVMGVSACGKSTIGLMLADRLGVPFKDGDDLHPQANIDKMAAGTPLDDADRAPWLELVGRWLADGGGVIACSALKRKYRDRIRAAAPDAVFVHLHGTFELMSERIARRAELDPGHFMPASLLRSQFDALELLDDDETGRIFDVAEPPDVIVAAAADWIGAGAGRHEPG